MNQISNPIARLLTAALLITSALGCSESGLPPSSGGQSGSAGQASGGAGSGGMPAGTSGSPAGGTPSVTAGAGGSGAGMGGGAGSATAGSGGSGGSGGGGAAGAAGAGGGGGSGGNDGWVSLFNGMNLDGWTPYGSNAASLFTVADGAIHVYPTQEDQSDQPQANMVHDMVLGGKYTLHVEYKWGEARFSDRKQADRDAGILFHVTGTVSKVWPDSIECQLGSSAVTPGSDGWTTGDLWVLGGPTTAQIKNAGGQLQNVMKNGDYGFYTATQQAELPHGQWNVVEVIVNGADEAIYMVNGKEVNRVFNMKYNGQPLSEGRISVQAEFAELFYRNIRYKVNP